MTSSWIIILNWNGKEDTLELLDSLKSTDLAGATVLVVDNGSADGSLEAVQRAHPWVRTLQTGSNLGYAGGNNRGIALAQQENADVIGVLNNDTIVGPDFWVPLVTLAADGNVAVSPDIRYVDDPESAWFYGARRSLRDGWPRHTPQAHQPPRDEGPQRTETLTGCCLVAATDVWRRVGFFDEGLFLIFEDADWSMRARELRVELLLQPASVLQHKVSRSFQGPQSLLGQYYFSRNGIVFAWRWTGAVAASRFAVTQVLRPAARDLFRASNWRKMLIGVIAVMAAGTSVRGSAGPVVRAIARAEQ